MTVLRQIRILTYSRLQHESLTYVVLETYILATGLQGGLRQVPGNMQRLLDKKNSCTLPAFQTEYRLRSIGTTTRKNIPTKPKAKMTLHITAITFTSPMMQARSDLKGLKVVFIARKVIYRMMSVEKMSSSAKSFIISVPKTR